MEKVMPFSGCHDTAPVALVSTSQSIHFILQIGMTCVPSSSSCGFSIIDELNRVDSWYTNDCQGPFWMLDNKCGTDCHDFGKFPKTCLLPQGNGIDGGIGRRSSGASKSSGGELGGGVGRTSISAGSL